MKKRFTAIALAALMLMMAFALVACGGEKTIVGTWKTDDSEAAGLGELPGTLFFIFEKDGSARFELDLKGLDGDEKAVNVLVNKDELTVKGEMDKKIRGSEKIINFTQTYYLGPDPKRLCRLWTDLFGLPNSLRSMTITTPVHGKKWFMIWPGCPV